MVKHPNSRAERIRLKLIYEKKEPTGKRRRSTPPRERDPDETDPKGLEG